MMTQEEAVKIVRRYWKVKRPLESVGMRHWELSMSRGSTNQMPDNDFEIPPQKKVFEGCWIIEMFNIDVKDYAPAYIAWVEPKTKKVVRSGIYEVHCLYDFSRWFIETTNKRERQYKLDSGFEIKIPNM